MQTPAGPSQTAWFCCLITNLLTLRTQYSFRFLDDATMLPRPEEQRKFLRRPMHRAAELRFDMHEQRARCRIWDMSDGGARLSVSHPIAKLPPIFTLVLFKDASVQRDCQVVWTDSRFVGIKFISPGTGNPNQSVQPQPMRPCVKAKPMFGRRHHSETAATMRHW